MKDSVKDVIRVTWEAILILLFFAALYFWIVTSYWVTYE